MTTPRKPRSKKVPPVKTTIRLSPDAHAELLAAADANRRSMNDELIARIYGSQVATLRSEMVELKVMVSEVLDILRDKL